jgi:hypothetical protein
VCNLPRLGTKDSRYATDDSHDDSSPGLALAEESLPAVHRTAIDGRTESRREVETEHNSRAAETSSGVSK